MLNNPHYDATPSRPEGENRRPDPPAAKAAAAPPTIDGLAWPGCAPKRIEQSRAEQPDLTRTQGPFSDDYLDVTGGWTPDGRGAERLCLDCNQPAQPGNVRCRKCQGDN